MGFVSIGYLFIIIGNDAKKKGIFFTIKMPINLNVLSEMKSRNLVMGLLHWKI